MNADWENDVYREMKNSICKDRESSMKSESSDGHNNL